MPRNSSRDRINGVLTALLEDLPTLTPGIVREIRAHVIEYDRVPLGDHAERVRQQQEQTIRALIDGRALDDVDLQRAAELGRVRARQGVSVEGVISAYHVGNRELWRLIDERADRGRSTLPELAGRLWEAIHQSTTAIAAAHSATWRTQHSQDINRRHRFVELLGAGDDQEATSLGRSLGLDPSGSFTAARVIAGQSGESVTERLQTELEYVDRSAFAVHQGETTLVLAQELTPTGLGRMLQTLQPTPRAGIGLTRLGLDGARWSIRDAGDSLLVTSPEQPIAEFEHAWWLACLVAESERLRPLLSTGRQAAQENPHLVDAIAAYAESGFSASAAATSLHVHPNSVAYRLDRWAHLVGQDPRTLSGALRALVSAASTEGTEDET